PFEIQQSPTEFVRFGLLDAFGRWQIWDTMPSSVLRLGADTADGDPFNADSEGIVVYQPSGDYMARVKANRFGLTRATDAAKYYFRVDDTQLFVRDRPTALLNLFRVDQATLNTFLGDPANPTGSMLFINQTGAFNSNAGIQHSSDFANRAQYRGNQFGANAGIPGVTGFKSRGTIGTLGGVLAGDVLWRATAIGVAADNASIPLAGTLSINAPFVGANYVATDFEVALVPLAGPINSRRPVFIVDSEGVLHVKEGANAMAGVAVTGAGGTVVVPNTRITANTRITLTVQDGGVAPTNGQYVSARVVGTSFTIQMIAAGDVGVQVYYQLYEPIP
ncbi:MAG TPA: hypothetical protein VKP00_08815, partial [Gemmatimonadaceae bacterium]|nr:hypothetical protein [Gemmatimonadaceae bacterium]